jgi:hypothetical protein
MESDARPAARTIGVPLPVKGSSGPVLPVACWLELTVLRDRVDGTGGLTVAGDGATRTSGGTSTTGTVVVVVEVVEVVEVLDVVDVELVVEVEVVDVVVAAGRIAVDGGPGSPGGAGAAPAAEAPRVSTTSEAPSSVAATVAERRSECRSTTADPPGCEST